jgi:Leucine-rich repeat (LRR) protein
LNLLNNNNLEYLSCNYNQLTDIVFPEEGAQLQYLDCIGNHLTEIDLGILPNLYWLNCGDNELVAINVSLNTVLELFVCANNLLTCLDLSQNPKLTTVICNDNDLSYLNVQNGFNDSLMQFWALNNNLSCIQVDNVTFFDTSFAPSIFVDSAVVYSTNCNYQDSCTASSLEEQLVEQESMLVYPNPVQEQLYVSVAEQARLKLFSLNGQLLKEEALHYGTHAVHVSDLAAGVYFYELQGSNTDERGKLIIAR